MPRKRLKPHIISIVIVIVIVIVDGLGEEDSHDEEPAEEAPVRAGRLLRRDVGAGVLGAPF
jgi:hypothetical protein